MTRRWLDPFGSPRATTASGWSSNLGFLNAPASATGLTQLGARAYDPGLGRFVSVDPVLDAGNPRGVNAYAYAVNSPVSFSDPSGLFYRVDSADGSQHITPAQSRATGTAQRQARTKAQHAVNGAGTGGRKIAPLAAGSSHAMDAATAAAMFGAPLTPKDQAWYDSVEQAGDNCSDFDDTTPCGYDWMITQAGNTIDLAMMVIPGGWIVRGLKVVRVIDEAASLGGGRSPASQRGPKEWRPGTPGVPKEWSQRTADNGKGTVWQKPGSEGNADSVRVMEPTTRYPDGYVRFYNKYGQPVGPNGKPGPPSETHIPRFPDGSYPVPEGWSP
ncbi:RHS repeat-associated core domain-containing protein [Microbacterium sp.]|uniref:RHS repeat-associated core domain-containing protein n=1 Tax=Microbacterium sp. TaxID=51671 RepID=UPI003A8E596B